MGYVINLFSGGIGNAYGYYIGKTYTHQGELYPCTVNHKDDEDVKVYKSKVRAENAAEKLKNRIGNISYWKVEEV